MQVYSKFTRSSINSSPWRIVKHIYATEGMRGYFRGLMPYLLVQGPGSAVWWASYEASKASIFKLYSNLGITIADDGLYAGTDIFKLAACVISGAIAGAAGYIAVNPLEVAKTRLQLLEVHKRHDYNRLRRGFFFILEEIYRREGIAGLFKGIQPRLMIRVPVSSVAFVGYEYLKESSLK